MKNILVIILFLSINVFAQKDTSLNVLGEVQRYINKEKLRSTKRHYDCMIYVLDVYREDSLQKGFSISMGYILNSCEFKYVRSEYYFTLGDDIILVHFDKNTTEKDIEPISLLRIKMINEYKLAQKLFPSEVLIVSGQHSGLIAYFNEKGISVESTYYDNDMLMPFERTVFSKFDLKGKIEKIEYDKVE